MAKLIEGDTHDFSVKYKRSRAVVMEGFKVLLAYDALDRKVRRAAGKYTATDDKNNGTDFGCLRDLVRLGEGLKPERGASASARSAQQAACTGRGD
jgi:hypothetical protein